MKKLLVISSDTIHVYNFIELVKNYFDEILLITDSKNQNYCDNVVVADFSILNPISIFKTPVLIRETVLNFNPSIIHIHQANSIAWYAFRAINNLSIPIILTTWGSDILITPKRGWWFRNMVKNNLLNADYLTADSKFVADEIRRLTNNKCREIKIVNFGIDLIKLTNKKEKLIYSNRLHQPLYRIDIIIKAFGNFVKKSKNNGWKLSIAGAGAETENLKLIVEKLGINDSVKFEGWVNKEKNSELYSRSSVFISIPQSDATSISLLEALACGCFPIVSDLPANREWIQHEINGYIVEDFEMDFITEAISCNFEKAAEINAGIINEHATKEVNRKRFYELYNKLIGR